MEEDFQSVIYEMCNAIMCKNNRYELEDYNKKLLKYYYSTKDESILRLLFAFAQRKIYVKDNGQAVIASKNIEWNYRFAASIEGADIQAHAQVVLESKDPEYNYFFAKFVKGANIKDHIKVLKKYDSVVVEQRIKELHKVLAKERAKARKNAQSANDKPHENSNPDTPQSENKNPENDSSER